ncbi:transcriptional regulator NrdR [Pediococcus stilesii]|uniref:Transcriptional repressor NrdR n=1 Tax=Pediococcus stilesii TaxID=331679 RepID=A0A0R2L7U9_9LACO|nr:transcriptional regulator NrdR [Pediococcus stilesii]KRN94644.1 transcriptional regulator NrdR [Pediococcus stilesii]TLQ03939.1 transcriptional repressor NrdR [Pediococcus stilesii]
MRCPHCGNNGSRVVDSRPTDEGRVIRRRRECEKCGFRFTTFERVEATPLLVIKKNGSREEFDRDKILRGIVRAAEKRPVKMDQMTDIVDKVENKVRSLGESEISSQIIGEYVMNILVDLDEIAYIRFASVYRQFKDMNVFLNELQDMVKKDEEKGKSK